MHSLDKYIASNDRKYLVQGLMCLMSACNRMAEDKGFWDKPRNKGEMMMLEVTEIAERLEAVRKMPEMGEQPSAHCPEISAEAEECADLLIRLADYCGGHAVDLGNALLIKMAFNASRPHMHGKAL